MNLQPTQEQVMLRDSAVKFLSSRYDFDAHRKIAAAEHGFSREIWREMAELGWLGLPFPEAVGGFGGGAADIGILLETFGRSLVLEPYVAAVVLGGGLVAALGTQEQQASLLPPLIEGERLLALAHEDGKAAVTAERKGTDYVLSGQKRSVLAGPSADTLLVTARLGADAVGVFAVPRDARGLTVSGYALAHGARAADVTLHNVTVPATALLGNNDHAQDAIALVIDRAIAALSADAIGAMAAMVEATVAYTKTRVQFGRPIAQFQALQFRMVDMKVAEEESRASCLFATLSLDGPATQRSRAVSGAKAKIGRSARAVHQAAIQLHGAIGTTQELSLGAYAKRLLAYEALFGTTREHLRRYAGMIADPAVASAGLLHEAPQA